MKSLPLYRRFGCLALLWVSPLLAQPAAAPATQPDDSLSTLRRGAYQTTFTLQDPRSPISAQGRRNHVKDEALQHYVLSEESFEVYVPPEYDPAVAYGIMVWTSAGDRGTMPRGWRELMDKHRLIYISGNNVGNERGVAVRFGMAMDGVLNLKRDYRIDEGRIYASGNSGGGKVSSMLAVMYPETFTGAIPIVGVSYFKGIPLRDGTNRQWMPNFPPPAANILEQAKELGRIVLITGSRDSNRDSMKGTYELGYMPDGFKFAEYVEVEGMGHTMPPIEYVDRAIQSLDRPLPQLCQRMLEMGEKLNKAGKGAEARSLLGAVYLHGDSRLAARAGELIEQIEMRMSANQRRGGTARAGAGGSQASESAGAAAAETASPEVQAAGLLSLAESYERNQLTAQARERAQRVVREFPQTKSAARARELIKRLDSRR